MMKRVWVLFLLSIPVLSLAACGLLREPEEASGPIEAIPLEVEQTEETAVTNSTATSQPAVESAPTALEEPETATPVATATTTVAEAATDEPPTDEPATAELRIYQINQETSQVRFELDEDLRGERLTVVGTTGQVAGEIGVDLNDLSTAQVGTLQINARTLQTDNNFRNRAIQNEILDTGAYEFIAFTPTAVTGLPGSAAVGEEISFTIEGDLTIRDITQPVIFDVTATAVSADQLTGTASTVIARDDYGLTIPSVPNVANVEEEVELYIDFVANASS